MPKITQERLNELEDYELKFQIIWNSDIISYEDKRKALSDYYKIKNEENFEAQLLEEICETLGTSEFGEIPKPYGRTGIQFPPETLEKALKLLQKGFDKARKDNFSSEEYLKELKEKEQEYIQKVWTDLEEAFKRAAFITNPGIITFHTVAIREARKSFVEKIQQFKEGKF